jgi:hypothetical protein
MATQTVTQAVPAVVPFPRTPEITQAEIFDLLNLRAKLNRLAEQVATAEQSIKTRLESGAVVEEGAHVARIEERFRANVAWKEKAIDLAERLGMGGAAWAQNVLTHTTKTRTVSLHVE